MTNNNHDDNVLVILLWLQSFLFGGVSNCDIRHSWRSLFFAKIIMRGFYRSLYLLPLSWYLCVVQWSYGNWCIRNHAEARKRLPENARGVRRHVTPILRILSFPRYLAVGSIGAHCASCKESNLYNLPSSPPRRQSTHHAEDLAGSDGNMRTVTDRASDRRNSTPTDHKWRKYPSFRHAARRETRGSEFVARSRTACFQIILYQTYIS